MTVKAATGEGENAANGFQYTNTADCLPAKLAPKLSPASLTVSDSATAALFIEISAILPLVWSAASIAVQTALEISPAETTVVAKSRFNPSLQQAMLYSTLLALTNTNSLSRKRLNKSRIDRK